ncbi:hypothetical protein D9C73_000543 [Collichthys lucidus]|uniref:Ig-like domain-containing protein n=1 Tax=Collichthys lucidus TaxID=240159 RepID=A0A4U5TXS6_COLLU|nr:hypothetical protein D9C73_000543 [Collichthys lucidus]
MMKMATVATVTALLLCCSFFASADSTDICSHYAITNEDFNVPLNHELQKSERLSWMHNTSKIYDSVRNKEKKENIFPNGTLKLTKVNKHSDSGLYIPEDPKDIQFAWFKNEKPSEKKEKGSVLTFKAEDVETVSFRCEVSNKASSSKSEPVTQSCFSSDEEELRLGWTNPNQQQQQQHHHHQHNHPPNQHHHHHHHHQQQQQPAGHTGPRQPRKKQQHNTRPRAPDPNSQPEPSPRRQGLSLPKPPESVDGEQPPPLPQPRKKGPKTQRV